MISLEFTPNPNTLKYSVDRTLLTRGAASFLTLEQAKDRSPLATRLLETPGISGVMIGTDFVTVTKTEEGDWDQVHHSALKVLESHLDQDLPILNESAANPPLGAAPSSEIEQKICEFLEREIRPAVATDGGDISFDRYENGIVYVSLQGSCAGCPSSTATLKMGIEQRLQQLFPEIKEVVSI